MGNQVLEKTCEKRPGFFCGFSWIRFSGNLTVCREKTAFLDGIR